LDFESKVISDFTGWWEKPREARIINMGQGRSFRTAEYSTVTYDIIEKNGTVESINKYEKRKPRL
jgi:hypothetical protein